jgi:hypothetical protein
LIANILWFRWPPSTVFCPIKYLLISYNQIFLTTSLSQTILFLSSPSLFLLLLCLFFFYGLPLCFLISTTTLITWGSFACSGNGVLVIIADLALRFLSPTFKYYIGNGIFSSFLLYSWFLTLCFGDGNMQQPLDVMVISPLITSRVRWQHKKLSCAHGRSWYYDFIYEDIDAWLDPSLSCNAWSIALCIIYNNFLISWKSTTKYIL